MLTKIVVNNSCKYNFTHHGLRVYSQEQKQPLNDLKDPEEWIKHWFWRSITLKRDKITYNNDLYKIKNITFKIIKIKKINKKKIVKKKKKHKRKERDM